MDMEVALLMHTNDRVNPTNTELLASEVGRRLILVETILSLDRCRHD